MKRRFLAMPSSVLVICLFLPALRVCGKAEVPATFPPCYAAYLGALGVLVIALARAARSRLAAIGAAIPLALGALTIGGIAFIWGASTDSINMAIGVVIAAASVATTVAIVRAFVRKPPSEIAMAGIALSQAIVSSFWTGALAADRDAMWGSYVGLFAGLAMAVGALAWRSDAVRRRREAVTPLPRAFAWRTS